MGVIILILIWRKSFQYNKNSSFHYFFAQRLVHTNKDKMRIIKASKRRRIMRIAFAGNPNSGKTTMYNALTGRNERVGNWAGVTVERKESPIKKGYYDGTEELVAVDLPGAYSMSPFTSEESITSGYVKNENPDVIINIVDATNLSRSLFFTTQLLELGIPVVVALNKSDIVNKKQTKIDEKILSEKLGCPVIKTFSTSSGHERTQKRL